jgi:hypothetical protein
MKVMDKQSKIRKEWKWNIQKARTHKEL